MTPEAKENLKDKANLIKEKLVAHKTKIALAVGTAVAVFLGGLGGKKIEDNREEREFDKFMCHHYSKLGYSVIALGDHAEKNVNTYTMIRHDSIFTATAKRLKQEDDRKTYYDVTEMPRYQRPATAQEKNAPEL